MNEIAKRILKILAHYNISAGEFALKLGIQKSSISHLLSERNKPSFLFLSKLARAYPEINLNWFITGEGDIFNNSLVSPEYENLSNLETDIETKVETGKKATTSIKNTAFIQHLSEKKLNQVKNIIMVFDNDTFKILKQS